MRSLFLGVCIGVMILGCASSAVINRDSRMDGFIAELAGLSQINLFERPAVERLLRGEFKSYVAPTVPPEVWYRSASTTMAPFVEATYRNNNKRAILTLWLDISHCYSLYKIDDVYSPMAAKSVPVSFEEGRRGISSALVYHTNNKQLEIGYGRIASSENCAREVVVVEEKSDGGS